MNWERIDAVAGAIGALGAEGIEAFDNAEPEYEFLESASERFGATPHLALLGILAGTQDYQLLGDAQRFWGTLDSIVQQRASLGSEEDIDGILAEFME